MYELIRINKLIRVNNLIRINKLIRVNNLIRINKLIRILMICGSKCIIEKFAFAFFIFLRTFDESFQN
jgi:hypothetical protein